MNYRIVPLEQGSPEWLAYRRERCTASDAPVIMDAAPSWYHCRTWDDLRCYEKIGLGAPPSEWTLRAWEHGREMEAEARKQQIAVGEPAVVESTADPRFAASLDGLHDDAWTEIKSPISGRSSTLYRTLQENGDLREEHPHVWWQLVHQAGVIGDGLGPLLLVYIGGKDGDYEMADIALEPLLADWPTLRAEWLRFIEGGPQWPVTEEWANAAEAYVEAKRHYDDAKAMLAEHRAELEEQGDGRGHGVRVTTTERPGSVDWKAAAHDAVKSFGLLGPSQAEGWLEKHRREPKTVTTIRLET